MLKHLVKTAGVQSNEGTWHRGGEAEGERERGVGSTEAETRAETRTHAHDAQEIN